MRKFGPKALDHSGIGKVCPACRHKFKVGDYTALVLLGPGDDGEARERARQGRAYNAVATEVHWGCATGKADDAPLLDASTPGEP